MQKFRMDEISFYVNLRKNYKHFPLQITWPDTTLRSCWNTHEASICVALLFVGPCIIVQFIKKNPTRCNNVSTFYYSIFIWSSTCFGRHTTHHQEPKAALPDNVHQLHVQRPSMYEKPEAASAALGSWWWAVCRPKHVELLINME